MRYFVLWAAAVAVVVLGCMAIAGLYYLWLQLWWLPFALVLGLTIATVVTAVDWWQDHPKTPRGPEDELD